MFNINGHYTHGNHIARQINIYFIPQSPSRWSPGEVFKHIRDVYLMSRIGRNMDHPSTHIPSHSHSSQSMNTQLVVRPRYSSAERSIIEVRTMIVMVRTMMANSSLCSSANLPETLAALEKILLFTELTVEAYRHSHLSKSLSRVIAVKVEHCRELLQELLNNLTSWRHILSETVLYFIQRYISRRSSQSGMADVLDSKLRSCHKNFAACLLALGR